MKTSLLLIGFMTLAFRGTSQCLTISCPASVTTTATAGSCGAVVNYNAPVLSSTCMGVSASDTFNYTGAVQSYTVPAGVTALSIETYGAQGGANWVNNVNFGGYVKGTFSVSPGDVFYIYVGGQPNGTTGGFNGGGNGEGSGQAGGGGTDVRTAGGTLNDRIIVAGGGGGAGYWSNLHVAGGVGGGLTGGDGYRDPDYASNPGGQGGNQTGSGTGTCVSFNNPAMAGGFGYGGAPSGCGCEGYGGGGGWWGGAGSGNCRGGGGGSGYALPIATNVSMSAGVRTGNGMVVIGTFGNLTPVLTQTAGLASGATFPVGTTVNSFTASDAGGNTASCSFSVTVTDNEAPVISLGSSVIAVNADAGTCGAVVTFTNPSATDNCSVAGVSADHTSGSVFPVGTTLVGFVATDGSGNTGTDTLTIIVTDAEAPVWTSPSSVAVNTDAGTCTSSSVALGTPSVSDNCAVDTVYNDAPAVFSQGVTTVTWTAVDIHGHSSTVTQQVTVTDNEAPAFTSCSGDFTMCEGALSLSIPVAADNCSLDTVVQTAGPLNGDMLTQGTYAVSFEASDLAGNTSACNFTVTVNPNPVAGLSLTIPSYVCTYSGTYSLSGGTPLGGVYSGPGVTGIAFDPTAAGVGTHGITYTYTDANGCTGSATDSVIVSLCIGLDEAGNSTFQMFPNPASGSFWIFSEGKGSLSLFDLNGKLLREETIHQVRQQVNLEGMSTGVYIIRFTTVKGVSVGRIIVK